MGSFSGTCEIVEAKELTLFEHLNGSIKTKSASRMGERDRKLPVPKVGRNKHLEDDLNQLLKKISINASSKSLDLSDSLRKNPSKNPIGLGVSSSPRSEITETVTLKKALRGLSISHASEVAAMKRLSKSNACSPRVSEAGRITSLYQSVVVESTESSPSHKGSTINLHLVMKESSSSLSKNIPLADDGTETSNTGMTRKEKHASVSSSPLPSSGVKMIDKRMEVSASTKSGHKVSPTKSGRKGKLQTVSSSSSINGTRLNKITRNNHRLVKPVLKKRVIKKKSKQDPTSINHEAIGDKIPSKKSQMVCERCQCAMKNVRKESDQVTSISQNPRIVAQVHSNDLTTGASKLASIGETYNKIRDDVVKANKKSKSKDKGEFSQSSKSSLGDYSTCTSVSEESNPSGSSCGNRPHMSKDVRWEAIRHAQGQHGNLGLTNFNLVKKLGCGDIGTVYLAELIGANCLFAIKVMDNEYLAKRKKMPRAQTEREILRMLDHPFLPTLYSQFTSDNLSCLVMEFCPGGDLHVLRQKQPGRNFPEHAARFYVAEVLLALEYLHMLGVVYRDLKPENILVREDGHIMLTDFDLSLRCTVSPVLLKSSPAILEPARMSGPCTGSSCIDPFCSEPSCKMSCFSPRMFPTATKAKSWMMNVELKTAKIKSLMQLVAEPTDARSNSFVGTHEYLAPEIIKGEGHGSAVDWWTYGIFLYELLYGKTPFKGSSNDDTLSNVVIQSLVFPDSPLASFQARDLIRRLLVKAPENRLGFERGAAEIKQHPFFEGLNWALIRCAIPPEIPEFYEYGVSNMDSQDKKSKLLEFELF